MNHHTHQEKVTEAKPSHEEVEKKAYSNYVRDGRPQGRDVQHWLDAEAMLIRAISHLSKE